MASPLFDPARLSEADAFRLKQHEGRVRSLMEQGIDPCDSELDDAAWSRAPALDAGRLCH